MPGLRVPRPLPQAAERDEELIRDGLAVCQPRPHKKYQVVSYTLSRQEFPAILLKYRQPHLSHDLVNQEFTLYLTSGVIEGEWHTIKGALLHK